MSSAAASHADSGAEDAGRSGLPPAPDRAAGKRRGLPLWQELIVLVALALGLAVAVKALLLQAFYIPSGSMEETLLLDDRIVVQKVSYWGDGAPSRGDVVVFVDPGGWLQAGDTVQATPLVEALELFGLHPTGGHLVKRVIGVGGDTVRCCDPQGRVSVNGTPLDERSYLATGDRPSMVRFASQVPEGYLWVMGDHRSQSADSRAHLGQPGGGLVPVEDVVGKVFAVVWPLGHAGLLHRPSAFEALKK